jgi:methyltransferase
LHPFYLIFLSLLGLERLAEMAVSKRNAAWARARGGVEAGRRHFPLMTALHLGFFGGCLAEVWLLGRPFIPALAWPMLALALLAQGLRYWAIAALGRHWNVRVIVVPGARPVATGPYRHLRHPNYLAVVLEGAAVPLMHTAYLTAAAFTVLNAWMLAVRIRCEEQALAHHCHPDAALANRGRLIPRAGEQR